MPVAVAGNTGIYKICMENENELDVNSNPAFIASLEDLPKTVFQNPKVNDTHVQDCIGLGLTETSGIAADDDNEYETRLAGAPRCLCQAECSAIQLCIDCLLYVCLKCQKVHHSLHKTVSHNSLNEQSSEAVEILDQYAQLAKQYQVCLQNELGSLHQRELLALDDINSLVEEMHAKLDDKKQKAVVQVKKIISAQRQHIGDRLEIMRNGTTFSIFTGEKDTWLSKLSKGENICLPKKSYVVPTTMVTITSGAGDVTLPNIDVETSITAFPVHLQEPVQLESVSMTCIKTLGTKGSKELQFKLPGGACVDSDSNLYVADEGNNRIQWISKDGVSLGSFTWVHDNHLISDVTFDPSTDKLIVPRAYSKHGLLKCSEFSYVSLHGKEESRFRVPGMKGGLLVHCGDQGHILISDLIDKLVCVIQHGHIRLKIQSKEYLKQPARSVFGKDEDILVVDSERKVVAIFDMQGLHIRDVGASHKEEQSLHRPSGVAVDKTCGIIAVADWCADKVFLFSYEGAFLASADGFRCPHSILMNDSHRMLVTDCWNNQLKVFSYSHSTQSLLNA